MKESGLALCKHRQALSNVSVIKIYMKCVTIFCFRFVVEMRKYMANSY